MDPCPTPGLQASGGNPSKEIKDLDDRIKSNIMQQLMKMQTQAQAQQAAAGAKGYRQAAAPTPRPAPPQVSIKLVHGDDIRLSQVPAAASYADVLCTPCLPLPPCLSCEGL